MAMSGCGTWRRFAECIDGTRWNTVEHDGTRWNMGVPSIQNSAEMSTNLVLEQRVQLGNLATARFGGRLCAISGEQGGVTFLPSSFECPA